MTGWILIFILTNGDHAILPTTGTFDTEKSCVNVVRQIGLNTQYRHLFCVEYTEKADPESQPVSGTITLTPATVDTDIVTPGSPDHVTLEYNADTFEPLTIEKEGDTQ